MMSKTALIIRGNLKVCSFNNDQKNYLGYHRENVFLQSRVSIIDWHCWTDIK